jgi:general secretion pathway protein F
MPAYEYSAQNAQGKTQKGLIEGDSPRFIRQQLKLRGLTVLSICEITTSQKEKNKTFGVVEHIKHYWQHRKIRLSHTDLTLLTRQMATLISAGLPIEETLSGLLEQTEKENVKRTLAAIRSKVTDGYSLSAALGQFPQTFSKLYIASVTAGEQTGRLPEVLLTLADHLENQYAIRQKVTQAMVYPAMMLFISLGIVIFLLVYVVPKIIEVFQDSNQALPTATQILLGISAFFQQHGILVLALIILTMVTSKYLLKKTHLRMKYEIFLLKSPFIGNWIKTSNTARFSRTLGILVKTGVSVLESMTIAIGVVERLPIKQALIQSAQSIKEGSAIHAAIKQTGYFNSMSVYLIANGESTGKLEQMLEKMAHYQEQELTRTITIGLSLFEPILILVMGLFTLFIVLAILLPIFSYNNQIV